MHVRSRMRIRGLTVICLAAMAGACTPITGIRDFLDSGARMARTVTIARDSWGVPYIDAETDAGVAFGIGYAQAEDDFRGLEEEYLHALGRAASVYGESAIENDLVRAAFEVNRLARDEYEREPPDRRALWDAWAAGVNHYLSRHHEVKPRAIRRFEPWFPFARVREVRATTVVNGVRVRDVIAVPVGAVAAATRGSTQQVAARAATTDPYALRSDPEAPVLAQRQSTAWVVAPARTRDGHALLFGSQQVDFFGKDRRWEAQFRSGTGWQFAGFALLGMPVPCSGHNEFLGWAHTGSAADMADAWIERFDHQTDPLAYRYGDDWRRAAQFEQEIDVLTATGIEHRRYRFLRTHRGPVAALPDGRRASIRFARNEEGGAVQQWLAMSRAATFAGFREAIAMTALTGVNTMYADREGNIHYLHGNAVPRRDAAFDWTQPLDGADPRTEWLDYHTPDELPHVTNPASGWIQNASSSPWIATAGSDNADPADYPAYMAPEPDNVRAQASRRLLSRTEPWTFADWQAAAFDTRVIEADRAVPRIVDEWERLGALDPERARRLDDSIDLLRSWDHVGRIGSAAMTLFIAWADRIEDADTARAEWPAVRALERATVALDTAWGTSRVAWGDVNRLQRPPDAGASFDTAAVSVPVPGGPGRLGIIFDFETRAGADGRRQYGVYGQSRAGVIEFGSPIRFRSISNFGQSADPLSPHWFDQASYYARGEFRTMWFTRDEVDAGMAIRYRPGKEPRPPHR